MLGFSMLHKMGELDLIERLRAGWGGEGLRGPRRPRRGVVLGIGDDCAILRPPRGHELLVTTDFTLEGRHFRRDWHPPESAGHRALARGLSDLAAMGARPLAAFLSLALPAQMLATRAGRTWVERFFTGLSRLGDETGVTLAGGDTAESPCELVLADIVLVGTAPAGRALRRSGGSAGDELYVTGMLGGAAAELGMMARRQVGEHPTLRGRAAKRGAPDCVEAREGHPQLWPEPRLGVGQLLLRRRLASAAIDLSDGLSTDLAHLCAESGVGAEIEAAALPIHPRALAHGSSNEALRLALNGGEDYELLFSVRAGVRVPHSLAGVRITRLGSLVRGSGVTLVDATGRRRALKPGGWEHFAGRH